MRHEMGSAIKLLRQILRLVCGIAFLSAVAIHGSADATTLARMSLEKMARSAPLIVRARCVGNSARWDAGEIWTFTSFNVEEIWRGSAPPEITVRLLGGRLGNLTSTVSGVPRFLPGEEVVLFLEPTARGDFSVTSWAQGILRIRSEPGTGAENATQDSASVATFDPATRRFEAQGIRNLPLDALRSRIDAAWRGASARSAP